MDNLYDNLENYNEANLIEELRNENEELKAKVNNCTETLEKLQKDFDKLEAEYKKLELNYSSLLKTARAEVERKTQIITNLNLEKDMMVLNAIQNKNVLNIRRNWSKGKANNNQPRGNDLNSGNKKTETNQLKTGSSSTGRKEASQTPSVDTMTTASTEVANKVNIKNERSVGRVGDAKENVGDSALKTRLAEAGSIRCRRKSMPATRLDKFSSDEEGEINSPAREVNEFRVKDTWGSCDRNYNRLDRQDRQDYNPYNRVRNYDNDNFRSRDRFEAQRNRFSPERFHRRSKKDFLGDHRSHRLHRDGSGGYRSDKDGEQRNYRDGSGDQRQYRDGSGDQRQYRDGFGDQRQCKDRIGDFRHNRDGSGDQKPRREDSGDRYQRPEHRKRRLESPPRDKYYQYQQKNHEQFEKDYYEERNKYLEDTTRVKYLSDYEEPSHKRLRTESHNSEQDNRGHRGQDPELAPQTVVGTLQVGDYMSCQSPDYLATELTTVPKEIKYDAEIKLDDPREQSNRYTIRIENGEKVLSTVAGRNIDLKPIKNIVCNIPKVKMPKALVIPPSQYADTVKTLYGDMDIENPASDISSEESGETMGSIYDITDPYQYKKDMRQREIVKKLPTNQEHIVQTDVQNPEKQAINPGNNNQELQVSGKEMDIEDCPSNFEKPGSLSENDVTLKSHDKNNVTSENMTTNNESLQTSEKLNVSTEKLGLGAQIQVDSVAAQPAKLADDTGNKEKVNKHKEKFESVQSVTTNFTKTKYKIPKITRDKSGSREMNLHDQPANNGDAVKHDKMSRTVNNNERRHDIMKGMVEGDLELSDENSDNIDLVNHVSKEINDDVSKPNVEKVSVGNTCNRETAGPIKQKSPLYDSNEKNIVHKQRPEQKPRCQSSEIKKSKKKLSKQIIDRESKQNDKSDALNKDTKQKAPETIMSKDIKNKFSDLFGDTSSLITPEDLGLTPTEMRIESPSSNYLPIFEDAQDALDLGAHVTGHKNVGLAAISQEETCIDKSKNNTSTEKLIQNEPLDVCSEAIYKNKSRKLTDTDNGQGIKVKDVKDTKSKSIKNADNDKQEDKKADAIESKQSKHLEIQQHGDIKINESETKSKTKTRRNGDSDKQINTHKPVIEQKCADKRLDLEELLHKSTCSINTEIVHSNKVLDTIGNKSPKVSKEEKHSNIQEKSSDAHSKHTVTKRRKSKRNEEKTQLSVDTTEIPQPAVITVENTTKSTQATNLKDLMTKEPDVVKTVIISTGVQPSAQEMPVNNFSPVLLEPPITPNIDSRQTRVDIPLLSHSVHIHALATSTPAKEVASPIGQNVSGTPNASNASDQTSQSNVNSQNDMEAPDVRIFVKRRKRVVKKTTPSKT